MKIIYDGMIYAIQIAGGINRYFAKIIDGLPEDIQPTLAVKEQRLLNSPSNPNLHIAQKHYHFRPGRVARWMEKSYFRRLNHTQTFDVAHPTYYSLLTGRQVADYRCPVVLTVYDMINELFPEMTDPTGQSADEKRHAILAAQAIICISENTKKDLLERYAIPEDRIHVTYLASDVDPATSYGEEAVPERPYFLYVGSRASYKNFDVLVTAFRRVLSIKPDTCLCVVGLPFTDTENKLLVEQNVAHRVEHYGLVGDAHLAKLYRCSVGFVYPSLYEGFGIPPLEAMACGTIAVAADTSSLPEVIGDAGILFNPYSDTELADILMMLLNSPAQREALIAKGLARAKEFNWDRTAAQTVAVYKSVCCGG